jgi:membrane protein YqaA with SNARE-associated domain
MLEFVNTDILILVALAAVAGGLSSVLLAKWSGRRQDVKREGWHEEERRRIEAIRNQLKGGT